MILIIKNNENELCFINKKLRLMATKTLIGVENGRIVTSRK